jgi:hypothetical protein
MTCHVLRTTDSFQGNSVQSKTMGASIFAVLTTVDWILQRLDVPSIRPWNEPGVFCSELPGKTFGGQKVPGKLYVGNPAYSVGSGGQGSVCQLVENH